MASEARAMSRPSAGARAKAFCRGYLALVADNLGGSQWAAHPDFDAHAYMLSYFTLRDALSATAIGFFGAAFTKYLSPLYAQVFVIWLMAMYQERKAKAFYGIMSRISGVSDKRQERPFIPYAIQQIIMYMVPGFGFTVGFVAGEQGVVSMVESWLVWFWDRAIMLDNISSGMTLAAAAKFVWPLLQMLGRRRLRPVERHEWREFSLRLAVHSTPSNWISYRVNTTIWGLVRRARACGRAARAMPILDPPAHLPLYEYQPLSGKYAIRLLEISPEPGGRGMCCRLIHCSAYPPDRPGYEAVSYRWSDSSEMHHLRIGESKLEIQASIYHLLRTVCPRSGARHLWIDAICINQKDKEEKCLQIPLMKAIYGQADRVLAYLGPAHDASLLSNFLHRCVFQTFEHLQASSSSSPAQVSVEDVAKYLTTYNVPIPFAHDTRGWNAFQSFVNHEYWRRMWIVQEIAAGRNFVVIYGDSCFSWGILQIFGEWFPRWGRMVVRFKDGTSMLVGPNFRHTLQLRHEYWNVRRSWPLSTLLTTTYDFDAKEAVDKVNALLGLAEDGSHKLLVPEPSRDARQTYVNAAAVALEKGEFEILSLAGLRYPRGKLRLPSWAPDLSIRRTMTSTYMYGPRYKTGNICFPPLVDVSPSGARPAVTIRGRRLCRVVYVAQAWTDYLDEIQPPAKDKSQRNEIHYTHRLLGYLAQLVSEDNPFIKDLNRNSIKSDYMLVPLWAIWRTILCDWDGTKRIQRDVRDCFHAAMCWPGICTGIARAEGNNNVFFSDPESYFAIRADEVALKALGLIELAHGQLLLYDFAILEGGVLSMVPKGTKPGDVACLFDGAAMAYILRQLGSDPDEGFELVGDAYIDEHMNGEKLTWKSYDFKLY